MPPEPRSVNPQRRPARACPDLQHPLSAQRHERTLGLPSEAGALTLMRHLGWQWKYLETDTTDGDPDNDERLAFLYDTRKVRFSGLAGELVLPDVKQPDGSSQAMATQLATRSGGGVEHSDEWRGQTGTPCRTRPTTR